MNARAKLAKRLPILTEYFAEQVSLNCLGWVGCADLRVPLKPIGPWKPIARATGPARPAPDAQQAVVLEQLALAWS